MLFIIVHKVKNKTDPLTIIDVCWLINKQICLINSIENKKQTHIKPLPEEETQQLCGINHSWPFQLGHKLKAFWQPSVNRSKLSCLFKQKPVFLLIKHASFTRLSFLAYIFSRGATEFLQSQNTEMKCAGTAQRIYAFGIKARFILNSSDCPGGLR